jgi:uncharacterized DUF497 family protein
VRFEWDATKNRSNLKKHGIEFEQVTPLFATDYALEYDAGHTEHRFIAIGLVGSRVVHVVFAEPSADTIRIISARYATTSEARRYRAFKEGEP